MRFFFYQAQVLVYHFHKVVEVLVRVALGAVAPTCSSGIKVWSRCWPSLFLLKYSGWGNFSVMFWPSKLERVGKHTRGNSTLGVLMSNGTIGIAGITSLFLKRVRCLGRIIFMFYAVNASGQDRVKCYFVYEVLFWNS